MPSEPLHDTPPPRDVIGPDEQTENAEDQSVEPELPVELSQFSQRLASFGLGEAPDPLLTESRPPGKRRPSR
jgi:hypothetical protein